MKNILIAIALLFSFNLSAQIPASLNVDLPWQSVRIFDCEDTMGEGPLTENENVMIQLSSDVIQENMEGLCIGRTRSWDITDLIENKVYNYEQKAGFGPGVSPICQEDVLINNSQLPYTLNQDNVVLNYSLFDEYSFSFSDVNEIEKVIESEEDASYEYYMYNHQDLNVCKLNVYLNECEEDVILDFPDSKNITFNKESYLELSTELLGIEIDYPCGTYTTTFRVGYYEFDLLSSSYIGETVAVLVEVTFDNGKKHKKVIQVSVDGLKPDPISLYIEEKTFVAGETIELEVWSNGVLDVGAWQLQLQFINSEVLNVEGSETFQATAFNVLNGGVTPRIIWYASTGLPTDVESDATWFTLTIKPDFDGSTADIFETAQGSWSHILIYVMDNLFEYEVEFKFNVAPRNILSASNEINSQVIDVFPNPSTQNINIQGLSNTNLPTKVEVFNLEGKLMLLKEFTKTSPIITLDISDLPTGKYIFKATNGNIFSVQKISKI